MGKTILFSPIGGTDPISEINMHDGPLLHVIRHYKPDIIYLYMSKEILECHNGDNRYIQCIKWLEKSLECSFDIRLIERKELEEVQLFDPIYEAFEKELDKILKELDVSDTLILNISSGTPAMKSALLVLATMIDIPCKCIQVDTPGKKMNKGKKELYSKDEWHNKWKENLDNLSENEGGYHIDDEKYNRTHVENLVSLKRLKYEETIKKYVLSYNYNAALILAKSMNAVDTELYISKLALADARQRLDENLVNLLIEGHNKEIYCPIKNKKYRRAYEYMLMLQAKVCKQEYPDFLRAISPLFIELFEAIAEATVILGNGESFVLSKYTYRKAGKEEWNKKKLQQAGSEEIMNALNNGYGGNFKFGWVKSDHLCKLIAGLVTDINVLNCVEELRYIEGKVRNQAAHNMIFVSDEWIENQTGFTCDKILELIRKAFTFTSFGIKEENWKSYDEMNEDIIRSI